MIRFFGYLSDIRGLKNGERREDFLPLCVRGTLKSVFPECLSIMGLAHPVSSKSLTRAGSQHFKIGAASMQGFRNGACLWQFVICPILALSLSNDSRLASSFAFSSIENVLFFRFHLYFRCRLFVGVQ